MAYDYEQQRREQQARDAESQRQQAAQRADLQRQSEARASQARQEAERTRAFQQNQESQQRQQQESVNRQRSENLKRDADARLQSQQNFSNRQQGDTKRIYEDQQRQDKTSREKQDSDRQRLNNGAQQPFNGGSSSFPFGGTQPYRGASSPTSAGSAGWPSQASEGGGSWSGAADGASADRLYSSGSSRGQIAPRRLRKWIALLVSLLLVVGLALAGLMLWRGYLSIDNGTLALHDMPIVQTSEGSAYRKFDMNLEFKDMNIWTKPKEVTPNSFVDAGPILNANLVCPTGDFRVKGDVRDGRITVLNGTLTIDGNVSGSFLAARSIVVHGRAEKSVEVGTRISNAGGVGAGLETAKIANRNAIVGFVPYMFNGGKPFVYPLVEQPRTH